MQLTNRKCPTYVSTQIDLGQPKYCPCCAPYPNPDKPNHFRVQHPEYAQLDEADVLVTTYGMSRRTAIKYIAATEEYNAKYRSGSSSPQLTPVEVYRKLNPQTTPTTGFSPLHCHCTRCGSTFTVLRTEPTTLREAPLYCVYCAHPVTVTQPSTDECAYISLAQAYHLPLSVLKFFYQEWTNYEHRNFHDYMRDPKIAPLVQVAARATRTRTPVEVT